MRKEHLIPKMFHRRLALLGAVTVASCTVLSAQLVRLTVADGHELRLLAESRFDRRDYLPTWRGAIVDRNGIPLAVDRGSFDVAVEYSVISGAWAIAEAGEAAREIHGEQWAKMSPTEREAALIRERARFDQQVEILWDVIINLGGIDPDALESRLDQIKRDVEKMAANTWSRQRELEHQLFGKPKPNETDTFDPRPIREQTIPHVILPRVDENLAFEFKRMANELPGLRVLDSWRREYPWKSVTVRLDRSTLPGPLRSDTPIEVEVEGVADHILGGMRDQVWASDIERRPFRLENGEIDRKGYRVGDSVGVRGLEVVYEDSLRGAVGIVDRHLNTGDVDRIDPVPGDDLHLTLDIHLQARVQAILSPEVGLTRAQQFHLGWLPDGSPKPMLLAPGHELNAAAVVLDVDTGDILAMVSMPTIAIGESWPQERRNLTYPYVNRAVEAVYPPGSIIKPLVLVSAVTEGVHRIDEPIECTGHYFPHWTNMARCWIYRDVYGNTTHSADQGPLGPERAIAESCNIYFYTLADELGAERLMDWYRRFGMGSPLDVGLQHQITTEDGKTLLIGENGGVLPTSADFDLWSEEHSLTFNKIIMGIGQGPIAWTPLQAANAYATLARGGYIRDATILKQDPRRETHRRDGDLQLDPRAVAAALEGLRRSVMEPSGTGHHISYPDGLREPIINAENVIVWAKTGTAEAPAMGVADEDGDGKPDQFVKDLDHAWFVGLVGSKESGRPQFAIAVIVEYGGSGGRTAGPIANQIIHALKAEGYL